MPVPSPSCGLVSWMERFQMLHRLDESPCCEERMRKQVQGQAAESPRFSTELPIPQFSSVFGSKYSCQYLHLLHIKVITATHQMRMVRQGKYWRKEGSGTPQLRSVALCTYPFPMAEASWAFCMYFQSDRPDYEKRSLAWGAQNLFRAFSSVDGVCHYGLP